ncbi:hypothetical protein SAMN05443575_1463 [Jatrophihabitans endophyticus]|uniref:Uncharacterized protein n=1 Tax=Jatrophihabitans endophyticus TaxID=1206085 RepID=A0A1M5HBH2_9ACTN|nr:hypothetical protein [Jatrophihabitans endophyticus]SHG13339.1 hypothetical protein SAMN05443575_1463 [Jatrophihabitans endophyticus]
MGESFKHFPGITVQWRDPTGPWSTYYAAQQASRRMMEEHEAHGVVGDAEHWECPKCQLQHYLSPERRPGETLFSYGARRLLGG